MRIAKRSIASALLAASASVTSVSAATLTSADFSFAFGATAAATGIGSNTWTDMSNTNSPPTQGDFTLLPAPTGQIQSNNGPKFFERTLFDGDPESDRVGALSDPFAAGGFSLPITASYNGLAPVDAAPIPNYRLQLELTRVSIYAATTQAPNNTLAWSETTPGFAQSSGSINLALANSAELLLAASSYTPLIWDPSDFNAAIGSLNNSFTRTFDFLPGTGNDGKVGDGIQVEGRVHLIYDTVGSGDPAWNVNSSGDYNVAGNWSNGVPNGVDAVAIFGAAITSARTVYTDTAVTLGTMEFENNNSYQLTGQGSLTIDVNSGEGLIAVLQGSHKINLPLIFADNTTVTVAGGSTLTIGDPATIQTGKTVTSSGNLVIQAPLTIEAGGSLALGPGAASLFGAPSLAAGASVDVQAGPLTIVYAGQPTPAAAINAQLTSGYNNGAWNGDGIRTSSATATTGLGWLDDAGTSTIQIQLAYYGDADLSGTVDSMDFSALVAAYGAGEGAVWSQGDFDYNGKVDTRDFNYLAGNFGLSLPAAALGTVVPEPASAGFVVLAAAGVLGRRRSRPTR